MSGEHCIKSETDTKAAVAEREIVGHNIAGREIVGRGIAEGGQVSIGSPEFLHISLARTGDAPNASGGLSVSYGAYQIWYPSPFGKIGGCGPTAAANQMWYLAVSRPRRCRSLCDSDGSTQEGMLELMKEIWHYIKPGMRGVNKPSMFVDGAVRYGADHKAKLHARVLEVPEEVPGRPSGPEVYRFLSEAFLDNLPVAFLNLSNGEVKNLDHWHWVTLVSINEELQALMYDQSRRQYIDLKLWLKTTTKGGAFVALEPVDGVTA